MSTAAPETSSEERKRRENRAAFKSIVVAALISTLSGLAVFAVLIYSVWKNHRADEVYVQQFGVHWDLSQCEVALLNYKMQHGVFPDDISQLPEDVPKRDQWGHPYHFVIEEGQSVAYSLGRDGKVRGRGLDADVYTDRRNPEASIPTAEQFFLTDRLYEPYLGAGVAAAACVFVAAFIVLLRSDFSDPRTSVWGPLFYVTVIVVFSGAIGAVLIVLHSPLSSGH